MRPKEVENRPAISQKSEGWKNIREVKFRLKNGRQHSSHLTKGSFYVVTFDTSFQALSLATFIRHLIPCAIQWTTDPFQDHQDKENKKLYFTTLSYLVNKIVNLRRLTLCKLRPPHHNHLPPRVPAPESIQPVTYWQGSYSEVWEIITPLISTLMAVLNLVFKNNV